MELRHLRYFLAVASELNFSRAAKKLYISQPPLSRQIKELEDELGARLFNRNNKKVELTEAGKYFASEAKQLLQQLEKAQLKTKQIAYNLSGKFRIAYISSTFSKAIPELVEFLSKKYPYVNFKLYEVPSAKQILALEQGKIDLGILRAPVLSPLINTEFWFRDSFSLVFNIKKNPQLLECDLAVLATERFIFFNKDYAPYYYEKLLEICAIWGFEPNVGNECNNIGSIIQMVKNGLGVSIVPSANEQNYSDPEIGFRRLTEIKLTTDVLLANPRGEVSEITKSAVEFLTNT